MNAKPVPVLSLAANVVLAVALVWSLNSRKPQVESRVATGVETTAKPIPGDKPVPKATTAEPAAAAPAASSQKFDWRLVESEDYRKYIANLRAIGCPEETIRDIITADVNKLYESKRKELAGP